ncbi:Aste57867_8522 [Aphanomyces stellatus]|uniref:Aste57867_8522 protein n=1 Tax=Aphanomyces stellatus TaxID=120398 RepID=A0A485KKL8_9STRA|nr:hypothetical protein As57867_008490 [Aphanomyces stellatus]VFT85408.1 Aste57867_8522 [Aphanomyces stellatus]
MLSITRSWQLQTTPEMLKFFRERAKVKEAKTTPNQDDKVKVPSSPHSNLHDGRERSSTTTSQDSSTNDDIVCVMANFVGLIIMHGATEQRQIRYSMEIVCPYSRRKSECVKRFDQFFDVRKKLLDHLKEHCICKKCATLAQRIRKQPFPARHLFTRLSHVKDRALPLEAFLQLVVDCALKYDGCKRTKGEFMELVSKFIGVPIDGYSRTKATRTTLDFPSSMRNLMVVRHPSVEESTCPHEEAAILATCTEEAKQVQDEHGPLVAVLGEASTLRETVVAAKGVEGETKTEESSDDVNDSQTKTQSNDVKKPEEEEKEEEEETKEEEERAEFA